MPRGQPLTSRAVPTKNAPAFSIKQANAILLLRKAIDPAWSGQAGGASGGWQQSVRRPRPRFLDQRGDRGLHGKSLRDDETDGMKNLRLDNRDSA